MASYRGPSPNFLGATRRLFRGGPPVSAYKLGLSLGEGPPVSAQFGNLYGGAAFAAQTVDSPADQNGLACLGIADRYGLALLGARDI